MNRMWDQPMLFFKIRELKWESQPLLSPVLDANDRNKDIVTCETRSRGAEAERSCCLPRRSGAPRWRRLRFLSQIPSGPRTRIHFAVFAVSETNTTLESNCTPIKSFFKNKFTHSSRTGEKKRNKENEDGDVKSWFLRLSCPLSESSVL